MLSWVMVRKQALISANTNIGCVIKGEIRDKNRVLKPLKTRMRKATIYRVSWKNFHF